MNVRKNLIDLKKRMFVSLIIVVCLGFLMMFSENIIVKTIFVFLISALASIGIWEYVQFARAKFLNPSLRAMIVVAVAEVCVFFAAHKSIVFSQMPSLVLALGAVLFFLIHFKDSTQALVHVAVEFFGVCYIAVPLSFMLAILYPMSSRGVSWDGTWWIVYLIFVTKVTDVGAYFVGRLFGKTKLAPILSPKKTVEGAFAGLACAIGCSIFIGKIGGMIAPDAFYLPWVEAGILGLVIGVMGQIGDLAESLLKRDAVVKDSNALPGLGGVLDMVDSLLLTAPIVYFYLKLQS